MNGKKKALLHVDKMAGEKEKKNTSHKIKFMKQYPNFFSITFQNDTSLKAPYFFTIYFHLISRLLCTYIFFLFFFFF